MAHGAFLDLRVIEMHEEGRGAFARPAVRHPDFQYRLGVLLDLGPHIQRLQQSRGGERQCIGAPVETGAPGNRLWRRVDQRHVLARLNQRKGKRRPVEPAADDRNIGILGHAV